MVKLEAGKYYRTRDGEKVGPMRGIRGVWFYSDPLEVGDVWHITGSHMGSDIESSRNDIVSEWTEPEFTADWPHGHVTRDGRKARIVCTDRPGAYPIVAIIGEDSSTGKGGEICRNMVDGRWDADREMGYDLLNAPATKREFWVNVYADGSTNSHATAEAAKYCRGANCIACVHVTEGDGL